MLQQSRPKLKIIWILILKLPVLMLMRKHR
uniref:Uncharacterized protein n=1 Tax=Siphoviridae sp. ct2vX3 TaxID=2825318 RepID=A0A8S5PXE3_9CAUD|nr:MAG TPA: hypothetical protein [Siphoviridae sp. ct2vX3]